MNISINGHVFTVVTEAEVLHLCALLKSGSVDVAVAIYGRRTINSGCSG